MSLNRAARLFLVFGCLLVAPVAPSAGSEETETAASSPERLARELIGLSGGGDLGQQIMAQMIDSFRPLHPQIPEEFWTEFLHSVDPREIEELIIPIYVEHLTVEEMSAAIEFYRTREGRSLVQKLPVIMRESMAVGQRWGEELGRELAREVSDYKQSRPQT